MKLKSFFSIFLKRKVGRRDFLGLSFSALPCPLSLSLSLSRPFFSLVERKNSTLPSYLAQQHRVDRLEVARVGEQRQVHALAAGRRAVVRGSQVVLDVARAVAGPVVLVAW